MLTEMRVTESPGTGWRDRGGRFIMHHYAPFTGKRQVPIRLRLAISLQSIKARVASPHKRHLVGKRP